ncbi:HlyD family type I secretion periplasmic adaptor subunit [Nitratireductor soli]|uniref:HlyD family type I secretion periplasmic adaptor subunit n=1 Tax=Nitratireductor soli TaxID=1670619 RepID=UPI00065E09B6|nr:HlyD family type I secretion periplasmic adaptor subunit [Nitratireductor soli]
MNTPGAPRVASPTLRATSLFAVGVFLTSLVAACIFRVEITARGSARVIPVGRVQLIQAEFSGAVTAIHVRDGRRVAKGQILIELDATAAKVERDLISEEETRLRIESNRLESLLAGLEAPGLQDGTPPAVSADDFPAIDQGTAGNAILAEQQRLLAAERDDIAASLRQATARIAANEKSAFVTRGNIDRNDAALKIQAERLAAAEKLVESGASSRGAYLRVLEEFTGLQKGRDVLVRELDQKTVLTTVLRAERAGIVTARRNSALQRMSEINSRRAALDQQRRAVERRIAAATLEAPVAGTVEQLSIFTIGGIAQAGESLMRIVPDEGPLEIEAIFANEDSGFLAVAQKVRVKLDAFPAERFGTVSARITDIAADAVETKPGRWGFIVRLAPETDFLDSPSGRFALRPGMTASVDAITGDRTLISYFIAPLVSQLGASLGER